MTHFSSIPFHLNIYRYNLECTYSEATGRGAKRKAAEEAATSDAPIPKPATVTSEVAQQILERLVMLSSPSSFTFNGDIS